MQPAKISKAPDGDVAMDDAEILSFLSNFASIADGGDTADYPPTRGYAPSFNLSSSEKKPEAAPASIRGDTRMSHTSQRRDSASQLTTTLSVSTARDDTHPRPFNTAATTEVAEVFDAHGRQERSKKGPDVDDESDIDGDDDILAAFQRAPNEKTFARDFFESIGLCFDVEEEDPVGVVSVAENDRRLDSVLEKIITKATGIN